MASLRRQRKTRLTLGFALAIALSALAPQIAPGAVTERIVVNPATVLAISCFDPVAYFTDGAAKLGRAELELSSGGVVWRFVNEGNRAAFAADPDVYMPQFGGYDPVAIARGVSTPGHPQVWLLSDQRLYLFFNIEARDAFASDPDKARQTAAENWPQVLRRLVP